VSPEKKKECSQRGGKKAGGRARENNKHGIVEIRRPVHLDREKKRRGITSNSPKDLWGDDELLQREKANRNRTRKKWGLGNTSPARIRTWDLGIGEEWKQNERCWKFRKATKKRGTRGTKKKKDKERLTTSDARKHKQVTEGRAVRQATWVQTGGEKAHGTKNAATSGAGK